MSQESYPGATGPTPPGPGQPTPGVARPTSLGPVSGIAGRLGVDPTTLTRARLASGARARFRMPGTPDPKARIRQLVGVAVWATVLACGGLVVGLRVVFGLFTSAPTWYALTICVIGLFGITCTIAAFASVHRRRMPWLSLAAATVTLIIAWNISY